jgi:hypothetical protein
MKRLINILGAGLTATLLSAGVAAAASLGLTSTNTLAAGSAKVTGCTSSALTATRNVDDNGNVTKVTVINVPQSCSGETLAVTLERASGKSLAGVSTTVGACTGGCAVSFTGFGTISAANIAAYAFSLTP